VFCMGTPRDRIGLWVCFILCEWFGWLVGMLVVSISVVSVAVSAGGGWRGWRGIELTCALFLSGCTRYLG
jgi:uncharacterized membrane protein YbjE (DUF340 family)